jgi:cysteinyl-tRNA synthetase
MSLHTLGKELDIHGGGMDLKFPHHENEIAQSEACTGAPFVRLRMHLGFVQVREAKMAKSLGNAVLIRDLVARFGGEALRLFLLGTHYRSPLMLTDEALEAARRSLWRLYGTLAGHEPAEPDWPEGIEARFAAAMDDDFNTSLALAVLFELARETSRLRRSDPRRSASYAAGLRELGGMLGLLGEDPEVVRRGAVDEQRSAAIETMIAERAQARRSKKYGQADAIREKLAQEGIVLEDGPTGTTWRLAGEEGVG